MVKVQVNFADVMCFDPVRGNLRSFGHDPRVGPDGAGAGAGGALSEYMSPVAADLYGIKEILSEKVRAVLTRRGVAPRDFVDMHAIYRRTGLRPEDVEACAIRKTEFAVRTYRRYRDNFLNKRGAMGTPGLFWREGDADLVAGGFDLPGHRQFVADLEEYLSGLAGRIDAG